MEKDILLLFELSRIAKGFDVSRGSRLLIELIVTLMFSQSEHFQTPIQAEGFPSMSYRESFKF